MKQIRKCFFNMTGILTKYLNGWNSAIIFVGLLFGISGITVGASTVNTKPVRETATTVNAMSKQFATAYYRLNQAKRVAIRFSGSAGPNLVVRHITLPKGTIVTDGSVNDNPVMNYTPDLSYYVKRRAYTKGTYGTGFLPAMFTFKKSGLTRVKRPAYLFPNQVNYFYTGGLKAFGDKNYHADLVKITTDGYMEYYRYHPITFTEKHQQATFDYRQKPNSYVKIRKTIKKGANTYLYFKSKLKGVSDKHIHRGGNYRYRLTIHNLHTPYSRIDPTVHYRLYASLYTFGGTPMYSIATIG
ncbi:MAG: hypothetical protein ABF723_01200 [Lentilactobacillus hilgardii]|uniref:hypothetical protein n=1 Tax=Lentilactobacillus hilgardii TaxID=1588 RepID=UPI001CC1FA9D|nr:hypothetical protein [Lentilactobacillus hilgardii]MBZ2201644.1 hypothetical protein [Lentilactobacillus hilgardii]MBZ2202930.1 hypothetical protein [Lentilactobacillus hilgardii]